jgi:hypothetical protein
MNICSKKFARVSGTDAPNLREGWFIVSHKLLSDTDRQARKYYGQWHKISCGRARVYRCLRTSPTLASTNEPATMVIDWDAWCRLSQNTTVDEKALVLSIRPARLIEAMVFGGHPDPGIRASYQIALFSLVVGIISLIMSLMQCKFFNFP